MCSTPSSISTRESFSSSYPNAEDGVPQGRDVVHTGEEAVLPCLGLEDDRADSLDLDNEGIPELDGALHTEVQVREKLVLTSYVVRAPVSRY